MTKDEGNLDVFVTILCNLIIIFAFRWIYNIMQLSMTRPYLVIYI